MNGQATKPSLRAERKIYESSATALVGLGACGVYGWVDIWMDGWVNRWVVIFYLFLIFIFFYIIISNMS